MGVQFILKTVLPDSTVLERPLRRANGETDIPVASAATLAEIGWDRKGTDEDLGGPGGDPVMDLEMLGRLVESDWQRLYRRHTRHAGDDL